MSLSSLPSNSPVPLPTSGEKKLRLRAKKRRDILRRIFGYVFLAFAFSAAIFFAGKGGVALALKNIETKGLNAPRFPDGMTLTLGGRNTPLYLADSPESLREFYLNFSDEESRSIASEIATHGMRRVFSQLEMTVQRYDADAVQVKITSGSISGAIYWIHISLLQEIPSQGKGEDEIISPIPSR